MHRFKIDSYRVSTHRKSTQIPERFYVTFCNIPSLPPSHLPHVKTQSTNCNTMYFQVLALGPGLQMVSLNLATAAQVAKHQRPVRGLSMRQKQTHSPFVSCIDVF